MKLTSRQADRFRETLRTLEILNDAAVEDILRHSAQSGRSPLEIMIQQAAASPTDIEIIDLLMRADEAIPGYELIHLIGRGGMGAVYRARQKNLNRFVALKTILASQASDKNSLVRFEREAVTIAQLAHPNIVGALDFGRHQGRLYLAMEIVDGEDLSSFITQHKRLDEALTWGIARQVAAGLLHASKLGIIHRDIKPANILLVDAPEGYPMPAGLPMAKISDFGLSILSSQQAVSERLTSNDATLGSPHYMSPEQLLGNDCDARADIYALGATVVHMLSGNAPWEGKSLQQIVSAKLNGKRPELDQVSWGVSSETISLVENMLEPDPLRRIHDYSQLIAAMTALSGSMSDTFSDLTISGRARAQVSHSIMNERTLPATEIGSASSMKSETKSVRDRSTRSIPTQPDRDIALEQTSRWNRKSRSKRWINAAIAIVLCTAGTVLLALLITRTVFQPILLEPTTDQRRLFNGNDLPDPSVLGVEGGWSIRNSRIVHEDGLRSSLTFNIPAWPAFAFEAIVELSQSDRVLVFFPSTDRCSAAQIQPDMVQEGFVEGPDKSFTAEGKTIELDSSRVGHSVRIQREPTSWSLTVDGFAMGSKWHIGSASTQIVLAVNNAFPRAEVDKAAASSIAISEIVVTRLQPIQQ